MALKGEGKFAKIDSNLESIAVLDTESNTGKVLAAKIGGGFDQLENEYYGKSNNGCTGGIQCMENCKLAYRCNSVVSTDR